MSIMPQPVDVRDSAQLLTNIRQCFKDIREAAAHSNEQVRQGHIAENGGLLGRVEAVTDILKSRLKRNWHQLAVVDVEGGKRWTFQQEIWNEVARWQNADNPLDTGEINFVYTRILELMRRGEQAYDRHELNRRGIAQAAWLQQRIRRAQLRQAHTHLQQALGFPGYESGVERHDHPTTLDSPFSLQPVRSRRDTTPSSAYLSSTASSSPAPSRSPSHSSHSPQLVNPSDLVLHEPRNIAPQVLHRSPRPRSAHYHNNSPLPPHDPYTDWQANHHEQGTIGHQFYFDEALHGLVPATSPHESPASYGFHSLGRPSHKLTRMRP
ncbi:hypothetical protein NBRC10512_002425 [Rhodotorula toruloides]|uniref:RHTO0S03e05666g1_1 n=2 Tax=Rhodotorula toruloides TaxID=5286 RepID=A0A061AKU2_RHOTO|nr:uncharacterized protein RHTO_00285 [Rhodotorula toruloides NP11]EMS25857.1 hypothetical protein RHTO_00285 [Rhodotorula toruloides NP11]CDR38200.1 RHTO0S03e05666g1_1 [Rhodotorula toruloides]